MSDEESIQLTSHLPSVEFFRRGEISNWMTAAGPLDVLHDMPARDGTLLDYEQLAARSEQHSYPGGLTVMVAGLDDIVASKEWANRDKDHEALPELYSLQERGRGAAPAVGPDPADPAPAWARGRPGGRTLANGLDHPGGSQRRPHERGVER